MTDSVDVIESSEAPKHSRRKPVKVNREMVSPSAGIESLNIEDMVLVVNRNSKASFIRLAYKGCPPRPKYTKDNKEMHLINMNRDVFIRQMYRIFKPKFGTTWKTYFDKLCTYIGWLDDNGYESKDGDYFHNDLIKLYMQQWAEWIKQGRYKKGYWRGFRSMISAILKTLNRNGDAARLTKINGVREDTNSHKAIHVKSELKPTVKALFRGFWGLAKHVENGSDPKINPIWDKHLFYAEVENRGLTPHQRGAGIRAFKSSVNTENGNWKNQLARVAAMICFMFTGMNTTPLLKMKRKDVKFKQIQGGKFVFEAIKGRSNSREIDNAIGFSKHARGFIERWLFLSAKITGTSDNAPLFPFITNENEITDFIETGTALQDNINSLLTYLGLTSITPSILRKTKLDTLMKVTEDIYLVSIAGNNSVNTIKVSYSAGLEQDHQRNLAATMDATFDIGKGREVEDAVNDAKYNYHDVLSEYDYKQLRKKEKKIKEAKTPLGVRCQNNKQGAAKIIDKALKRSGITMPSNEVLCTDFLECFECENHKLVAAIDDIWLMLSFKDTLKEMLNFPSVNSMPESRYKKLCLTIDSILARFKEVSEKNYLQAQEQKKISSHPLYSTPYSLNDLLETFSWT